MEISTELQKKIDKIIELLINEEEESALTELSKLSNEEQEKANYTIATLFDT
jgi:predicted Zn-ribbon and HTH transcriptional regulator